MQVTPSILHWAYRDAIRPTAEQSVLDIFAPDLTQKGFHETLTQRAAVRSGGAVRMGLLYQMGHQGVIDYINGQDIQTEFERYDVMMEPVKGRAH